MTESILSFNDRKTRLLFRVFDGAMVVHAL
jgi:hypothetical protein